MTLDEYGITSNVVDTKKDQTIEYIFNKLGTNNTKLMFITDDKNINLNEF